MSRARLRALLFIMLGLAGVAAIAVAVTSRKPAAPPPRPANERPSLMLLTSLPLMFSEDFSLDNKSSAAAKALDTRYRLVPINVTSSVELAKGRLLLMAHPLAQPAEDLVALDAWVRRGGRVLLLADPLLEWPSERPLGDPLRAPPMFMDTGLLAHWGLRLRTPRQRGPKLSKLSGFDVVTNSAGELSGSCAISGDGLLADCRIGAGRALVIADADLLDVEHLDPRSAQNLNALLATLATLERK